MKPTRRAFVSTSIGLGLTLGSGRSARAKDERVNLLERLDRAAAASVLETTGMDRAVNVKSMELLRSGREFVVRVRSDEGVEGLAVPNSMHMVHLYPIFLNRIAPFFVGKDARGLEGQLWELYRHDDNYKYQGLALWVCTAAAEFALLDLLGKTFGKSLGELLGGVKQREIAVYRASGTRGNPPEAEVDDLRKMVEECGAKALKFRLGGRMSKNVDSLPGRTEALIPLVREAFGPEMTLYADSNSSYDVPNAIRIGRIMEEHRYAFYEEPCEFDRQEDTKAVADALKIPVAWGEQEFSDYRFRWTIANQGVDIVQPDLHYYGGFIRSLRVARMAHEAGMLCTPHMSGSGLGYLDAAHFASLIPNPVPFTEFKGSAEIPVSSETSTLKVKDGKVVVPSGPGFGVTIEPDFLRKLSKVTT